MDIGFLLGSSTLCLSSSISHSFLSLLEQFANNILVRFYLVEPLERKKRVLLLFPTFRSLHLHFLHNGS